ncbi:hypothetical protein [Erwinia amylovora]|uniref:hypothetical protein n=1 Tax=Erwinia amylovora TaxID=552 RepID=UPI00144416A1|nr:hypothetical protein [Erwinia amylovora]
MSEDGFKTDDLSGTLARFASKRRNIIQDESRLERKIQEPVTLPSATHDCGAAMLRCVTSIASNSDKPHEKYESSMKYSWEKKGFFRHKDGF